MNRKHVSLALAFSLALAPHCGEEQVNDEQEELTIKQEPKRGKTPRTKTIRMSSEPDDFEEDSDLEGDLEFEVFQSCIRRHAMVQMQLEPVYYGCVLSSTGDHCYDYNELLKLKMEKLKEEENTVEICWDVASGPPSKFTTTDPRLDEFKDWLTFNGVDQIRTNLDMYGRVDRISGHITENGFSLECRSQDNTYLCSLVPIWNKNYVVNPSIKTPFTAYDFESGINESASNFFYPECYLGFSSNYEPTPDNCEYVANLYPDCGLPFACYEVEEDTGSQDTGFQDTGSADAVYSDMAVY